MCQISPANLLKIAPAAKSIDVVAMCAAINEAALRYGINQNVRRMRYFLAQTAHETGEFTKLAESLYYTDPVRVAQIFKSGFDLNKNLKVDPHEVEFAKGYLRNSEKLANRAYANRFGNGDEASGDGFRFRGQGLIMLTFKDNYRARSQKIYGDDRLVRNPETVSKDLLVAALCAGCFWKDNGLNELADADSFTMVSRKIQGDASTVTERLAYLKRANQLIM